MKLRRNLTGTVELALAALILVIGACSVSAGRPMGDHARPPEGFGRLYVLRKQQTLYSALPVTVTIDDATIGTLARGTYRSVDLRAGAKSLTVSVALSRFSTHFKLRSRKTVYVLVTMQPSGLPPPRGAVGAAPAYRMLDEPGVFSIQFLDKQSASAALANLKPAK